MNIDAERGTLAALITIEDFGHTLPFKLSIEDFRAAGFRVIAKTVLNILESGQKPNKNLILSTAKAMAIDDFDETTKGGKLIDEIMALSITQEEAVQYVRHLKKESIKRTAAEQFKNLVRYIGETEDGLTTIISKLEDTTLSITSSADYSENVAIKLADIIDDELDFLGNNPGHLGLDIGFPIWQERIGGISNGLVHMVIATHKTGKSNIGMNAAIEIGKHMPVLYIDTEMTPSILTIRMLSNLIKVPTKILKEGFWNDPEHDHHIFWNRIQQGREDFKKLNITYIHAAGKQVSDMIAVMRRWVIQNKVAAEGSKYPKGLIIFDYLKLAGTDDLRKYDLKEYQLLGLQASALKDFCNKYGVPCITFGQTNREDDQDINCLGASKRLADLVDSVTLFKQKTPELLTQDPTGSHLMRVFLARHGPATGFDEHIQMQYDKDTGVIGELGLFTFAKQDAKMKYRKKKKDPLDATTDELIESEFGTSND
jgi:replicative DNA helicase